MIVEFLLSAIMGVVTVVMNLIPDLPAMPSELVSAGGWLVSQVASVSGFLAWFYGQGLYIAMITVLIALLNFEFLYHATLWVLRKLPFNIH